MTFALWLIGTLILGLLTGFYVGIQGEYLTKKPFVESLLRNRASDRDLLFRILRRELANWMIWHDPDRYKEFYEQLHLSMNALIASEQKVKDAKYTLLTEKYPMYSDFDLLGMREHVLYGDAFSSFSREDIEQHFKDMAEFQALMANSDEHWKCFRATNDSDLKHLKDYSNRIKDTKFKKRLVAAVREYWAFRRGCRLENTTIPHGDLPYETDTFSAKKIHHMFELAWGYHFKDTNEYGLHTIFDGDDKKSFISFERSDAKFELRKMLHEIVMNDEISQYS